MCEIMVLYKINEYMFEATDDGHFYDYNGIFKAHYNLSYCNKYYNEMLDLAIDLIKHIGTDIVEAL